MAIEEGVDRAPLSAATAAVVEEIGRRLPAALSEAREESGEAVLELEQGQLGQVLRELRDNPRLGYALLLELTAVDCLYISPKERYQLVYRFWAPRRRHRLRLEVGLAGGAPQAASAALLWPAADWLEREVYEMFGIEFSGHPRLRRLLLPAHCRDYPLRKDYALPGAGERERAAGAAPPQRRERLEAMVLQMDPPQLVAQGPLRLELHLDGETIVRALPEPGYAHAGLEKLGEYQSYFQYIASAEKASSHSPFAGALAFVLAVERLLDLRVPRRGQYLRVVWSELARMGAHLSWLATQARLAGAETAMHCALEQRRALGDLFAAAAGSRTLSGLLRLGGLARDLPEEYAALVGRTLKGVRRLVEDLDALLSRNRLWMERTRGVGAVGTAEALAWGLGGPVLRATGMGLDLRKSHPYSAYEDFDFAVPVGAAGDTYERYLVRLEELVQSSRIVEQALAHLPPGAHRVEDPKLSLPPKEDVRLQVEALIHHFKLLMEGHGLQAPAGARAYVPTEGPGGEVGFFVVSDGTDRAYRARLRAPSLLHCQFLQHLLPGLRLEDAALAAGSMDIATGEMDR